MSEQLNCEYCGRVEYEDQGSWNKDPYLFFCCEECHEDWSLDQGEDYDYEYV